MNQQQLDLLGLLGVDDHPDDGKSQAQVHDRGELHVHLNGAIPLSTIQKIMADEATSVPDGFDFELDMMRLAPCKSLAEYLTPWQVLRLFPKKRANLDLLAHATLASLAENAVRFVELRSSVLYLTGLQRCTPAQALERLIESTGSAAQHYGIRRGLILTVTRGDYDATNLATLLQAYEDIGRPKDVVGLDLAGDEETPYSAELPAMIREAKDRYGFGITIHAGETGRVENVRAAVEFFHADRIGHGTAAGKDPELMGLLAAAGVCVEVCPISNRLTSAVPRDEAHPLQEFRRRGVPFVICSDNPAIHQRGLADDQVAAMAQGLSISDMQQQYEVAKRFSFMEGLN